jgi:hypothetical protein
MLVGFLFWPSTPIEETDFSGGLLPSENLIVLPIRFLSHNVNGADPGGRRMRLVLVTPWNECVEAAQHIRCHVEFPREARPMRNLDRGFLMDRGKPSRLCLLSETTQRCASGARGLREFRGRCAPGWRPEPWRLSV